MTIMTPNSLPSPVPMRRSAERGYHVAYRGNGQDWCPGCSGRHWLVGRMMAEGAWCGCAVPLNLQPEGVQV